MQGYGTVPDNAGFFTIAPRVLTVSSQLAMDVLSLVSLSLSLVESFELVTDQLWRGCMNHSKASRR